MVVGVRFFLSDLRDGWRVLLEAGPVDRIWGIGLTRDDPAATNPGRWPGLNLLGFALMRVRDTISTHVRRDALSSRVNGRPRAS